eukprot:CAMPEP_0113901230 /NCGR_PEP_ID=MMETSP0780_2-20120614/21133_1 /TAXON_ID=652834 /ORGANISM="Palpitomonas bilix" /LENGTH=180 /DNA_ID=CAMNT_0000893809 /DNA_START=2661 /DNA_END=3203 /DNA_ORIENTATION=- /assembly_acc=CAM_ASM_000599
MQFQEQEKRLREEQDKRFQEQETRWKEMFRVMQEKHSAFEVENNNRNAQIVTLETKMDELEIKLKTKTEELETLKTKTTVELETLKTKTEALEVKNECSEMHIEELKSNIEENRNKQKQEMAELQMRTARLEAKDAVLLLVEAWKFLNRHIWNTRKQKLFLISLKANADEIKEELKRSFG